VNDGTAGSFGIGEIPNQIRATRARPSASGYVLYNTTTTVRRDGGAVAAAVAPLNVPRAIPPASTWLDALPPDAPMLTVAGRTITLAPGASDAPRWWVVRVRIARAWTTRVLFGDQRSLTLAGDPERVIANAIDQAGNASTPTSWASP
jgi:hypothetical protein